MYINGESMSLELLVKKLIIYGTDLDKIYRR